MTQRPEILDADDRQQIAAHGLTLEEVSRQLELYRRPASYTRLRKPCLRGDGIRALSADACARYAELFDRSVGAREPIKFVPASGAASRMFKTPLRFLHAESPVGRDDLRRASGQGDRDAAELEALLAGLERTAFYEDLTAALRRAGHDPATVQAGDVRPLLEMLLTDRGLGYAALPKALLRFHRYRDERRTAMEEHLVEATRYSRDAEGRCRLHFTVSGEHLEACREHAARASLRYGERFGVRYDVGFSLQKCSTDSLAVDPDGRPFRDDRGRLLLRPAGHGALLDNLADLAGDIVFIKNIDNVVPDHLKDTTYLWKRALGGLAIALQERCFDHLAALDQDGSERAVEAALAFARDELGAPLADLAGAPVARRSVGAVDALDRPLRVCGMVLNQGEAGGGPFWAETHAGVTKQIVESTQVDPEDREQQQLLASSTHFNPVDLVCLLRDRHGRCYDLPRFVDPNAYLVVEKSHEGRPLRALERPGLWNGSMAYWNTVFVEVPVETFTPVKTVNDLLRPAHQSA